MSNNKLINDLCFINKIKVSRLSKNDSIQLFEKEINKNKLSIIENKEVSYIILNNEYLNIIGPFNNNYHLIDESAKLYFSLYFNKPFNKKTIPRFKLTKEINLSRFVKKHRESALDKKELFIFLEDSIIDKNIEVSKLCIKMLLDTLEEEDCSINQLRLQKNLIIYIFSYIINIIENNKVNPDFNIFLTSIITSEFEYCDNSSQLLFKSYQLLDKISDSFEFTAHKSQSKIKEAKYYITNNLDKKLTLEKVAKEMGISAKYLSTLFFEITNMTFKEFIIRQKIEKAKNLLSYSQLSMNKISKQIGINSPNNFISFFKKYTNSTPTAYREQTKTD